MTGFVIASLVLAVLVLGLVLRPVWRDRPAAGLGMLAVLAVTAGLLYTLIGTPQALDPAQRQAPQTLADAVAQLEAELEREPNQIEGWRLLARAYAAEGRTTEARDAFARALALAPDDPDLLAEAAEARAMAAEGRRFDESGVAMLRHALEVQPRHQRARWFLGIAQRQAGQSAEAARTWEPLLAMVDERTAASLREQIDLARADAGLEPLPPPAPRAGLAVTVSLSPELAARLPADASLFVIARQPGGPPMPVAVEKLAARGFPVEVVLDDGDSPMPTLRLSQLDRVEVSARVSASGQAVAEAGDLEAAAIVVELAPDAEAEVVIDRVVE